MSKLKLLSFFAAFFACSINLLAMTGSGTEADPYHISAPNDLLAVNNNLSAHYVMDNDIDLSSCGVFDKAVIAPFYDITSIPFSGVFDGSGYSIPSGVIIEAAKGSRYIGLFGVCDEAEITNLNLNSGVNDSYIKVLAGDGVGSIAGNISRTKILSCSSSISIMALSYVVEDGGECLSYCIGGVVGCATSSNIMSCSFLGEGTSITVSGSKAGGIVGNVSDTYICECEVSCAIYGTLLSEMDEANGESYFGSLNIIGGICGDLHNIDGGQLGYGGCINNCYADISISGLESNDYFGRNIGGVVGLTECDCYNSCSQIDFNLMGDSLYIGGVCGSTSADIVNCSATGIMELVSSPPSQDIDIDNESVDIKVGGVCGFSNDDIKRCFSNVHISLNYSTVDNTVIMTDNFFKTYVGGIVGYGMNIENSYCKGEVSGLIYPAGDIDVMDINVGGAFGVFSQAKNVISNVIVNVYYDEDSQGTYDSDDSNNIASMANVGLFAGRFDDQSSNSITYCFLNKDLHSYDIGIPGYSDSDSDGDGLYLCTEIELADINTFLLYREKDLPNTWDFDGCNVHGNEDIWYMQENGNMPQLTWEIEAVRWNNFEKFDSGGWNNRITVYDKYSSSQSYFSGHNEPNYAGYLFLYSEDINLVNVDETDYKSGTNCLDFPRESLAKDSDLGTSDYSNDYMIAPHIIDPSEQSFTLMLWLKGSGGYGQPGNTNAGIVSQKDSVTEVFHNWLILDESGYICSGLGSVDISFNQQWPTPTDSWHHVALVWDNESSKRTIYFDGKNVVEDSSTITMDSVHGEMYIGYSYFMGQDAYYKGKVDDIRIFTKALSNKEIRERYIQYGEILKYTINEEFDDPYNPVSILDTSTEPYTGICSDVIVDTNGISGQCLSFFNDLSSYVELDGYKGIGGNAARTVSTWIKVSRNSGGRKSGQYALGVNLTRNSCIYPVSRFKSDRLVIGSNGSSATSSSTNW